MLLCDRYVSCCRAWKLSLSSRILESAHLLVRCVYVCELEPIKMWESASICGDTNRNNVWSHLKCDTLRQKPGEAQTWNLWIGLQAVSECWEAPAARQHSYNSDKSMSTLVTRFKLLWRTREHQWWFRLDFLETCSDTAHTKSGRWKQNFHVMTCFEQTRISHGDMSI